jgi:hypothetical protein
MLLEVLQWQRDKDTRKGWRLLSLAADKRKAQFADLSQK